jgi:hypothetical protein
MLKIKPITSISHIFLFNLTNYTDFCDIKCAKKRARKSFQCSKAMDQCGEVIYKGFSHTCLPYHIKYTICSSLNKHTLMFYPIFIPQRKIPMDYIKIIFSLLITTLYSTSSMQWNVDFFFQDNYSKKIISM